MRPRPKSAPWRPDRRDNVPGYVYLLHFSGRVADHAQHYVGWTADVKARTDQHRAGQGAKLLAEVKRLGLSFEVVAVWPGTRNDERRLKRRHHHGRYCAQCSGWDSHKVPWQAPSPAAYGETTDSEIPF